MSKIDKSKLKFGIPKRIRDRKYLDWLRTLPCCRTNKLPCDPAHISVGNNKGIACKVGDDNCVPLTRAEHQKQHSCGEKSYWGDDLDRAKRLAKDLYQIWINGGDKANAVFRILKFQRGE